MNWSDDEEQTTEAPTAQKPVEIAPQEKQAESTTAKGIDQAPVVISVEQIYKGMEVLEKGVAKTSQEADYESFMKTQRFERASMRCIFTKNMQRTMPDLKWLPGNYMCISPTSPDEKSIDALCESARRFKVVSFMLFIQNVTEPEVCILSLTTPEICLYFDIRAYKKVQRGGFAMHPKLLSILSEKDITVVMPGKTDWYYTGDVNSMLFFKGFVNSMPSFPNLVELVDYNKMLKINVSCKDICEHMKMIHWIFQVQFNSQMHMGQVPVSLSTTWKEMIRIYGSMLVYLYWALEIKRDIFRQNPQNGVDVTPIYLEKLLIQKGVVTGMSEEELKAKLIGTRSYPMPPLPNLAVKKK